MSVAFKIRRKTDGLYSRGSSTPTFNKVGKTWSSIGNLSNHLALVRDGGGWKNKVNLLRTYYGDCEIVILGEVATRVIEGL